jgi:hypothetical protein
MSVQTTYETTMPTRIAGQLADRGSADVMTMYNREASAEIPFGRAVKFGSTTDPTSAVCPTAQPDLVAGIVLHSYQYAPGLDLGDDGILPDRPMQVLRRGRVCVLLEDAVTVGARGWVRAVAAGAELLGGILPADDGTDTIDCTGQIVFLEAGDPGDIVIAEVNFSAKPT